MRGKPIVMDGEFEFASISDAARFICERDGINKGYARAMVSNIHSVIGRVGNRGDPLTAYGHVWTEPEDDARTAAYGYEKRIEALESLIRDMLPYMGDEIGSEGIRLRVRELGLEER